MATQTAEFTGPTKAMICGFTQLIILYGIYPATGASTQYSTQSMPDT